MIKETIPAKSVRAIVATTKIHHEKRKHPRDRSKIIIYGENEVRHWARHLGVTPQELTRAIERVGNSAATARKQLATSKLVSQSK